MDISELQRPPSTHTHTERCGRALDGEEYVEYEQETGKKNPKPSLN